MTNKALVKIGDEFSKKGYVILPDFFSAKVVEKWRAAAERLFLESMLGLKTGGRNLYSYVVSPSFVLLQPTFETSLVTNHLLGNAEVKRVLSALLGTHEPYAPRFEVSFNTPGRKSQHVHRDFSPIFPRMREPLPTTAACVTVPLVDSDESNGTLELWPGTHRLIDDKLHFLDPLDLRVKGRKSLRPKLKAGSLFVRDTRLIHRGVANRGTDPRPWLVSLWVHPLIHFPNKAVVSKQVWKKLNGSARKTLRFATVVPEERA